LLKAESLNAQEILDATAVPDLPVRDAKVLAAASAATSEMHPERLAS